MTEEKSTGPSTELGKVPDDRLKYLAAQGVASAAFRKVVDDLLARRQQLAATDRALADERAALKEIVDEQGRLRENMKAPLPPDSKAFQRYLAKLDAQEGEIERRQGRVKELAADADRLKADLAEFVRTAKAD